MISTNYHKLIKQKDMDTYRLDLSTPMDSTKVTTATKSFANTKETK